MTTTINVTNAAAFGKSVTFEQYLAVNAKLDAMRAAIVWPEGTGSGAMGLTPDHIKATPEFRYARSTSETLKEIGRKFNGAASKRFKKEIRAHIDAKRAVKLATSA